MHLHTEKDRPQVLKAILKSYFFLTEYLAYIGDERYYPIWIELNRRKAVVFLHGSQVPSSTPYPHPFLGIPITEVSGEH